jgi:Zn2+/Cd2+-exporting ATPase
LSGNNPGRATSGDAHWRQPGDNNDAARRIAQQVGVTDVRAELLPEEKLTAIKELQAQYGESAMIGDGVNDAPALATGTVGIAMGGAAPEH